MSSITSAVIFQNGSIGDFLMAVTLARQLLAAGIATITIIVPRGVGFLRGFTAAYPFIHVVEVTSRRPLSVLQLAGLTHPKTLVVLSPTIGKIPLRSKLLAWGMTRLPKSVLVGFQDAGPLSSWYTYTLPYNTNDPFMVTISQVLTAIGLPKFDGPYTLDLPEDTDALKEESLVANTYTVLHPCGSSDKRSFTEDEAVSLINALLAADSSLRVVLTGSKADADFTHAIQAKVTTPIRVSTVLGGSPAKLAAVLKHARFFVGVDTGTTHIACFLGARVIVVAHNATANWLPYYHSNVRVLYRLDEDTIVHEELSYLNEHRRGRIKPFGRVPSDQLIATILPELHSSPARPTV